MLHVMDSPLTDVASGRGVVRGLLYTADGLLVATTFQEGVVRADLGGKKEKGLVEGGGVGDEEELGVKSVKAKL
jgi:acyl-CoA thioesterase 8